MAALLQGAALPRLELVALLQERTALTLLQLATALLHATPQLFAHLGAALQNHGAPQHALTHLLAQRAILAWALGAARPLRLATALARRTICA